jgi:pimeloyl-ACP methyl ester carboxylesterase
MTKIFIHGANSTNLSWSYIQEHIGNDSIMLDYNSDNGFKNNLEVMKTKLENINNLQFVAHSFGGIYALHLANYFKHKVISAVTLSTPYGGCTIPYVSKLMFSWHQLLNDIQPDNWPINSLNNIKLPSKWCNIVTTTGNVHWIFEKNDGVVTIKSQMHRNDMELIQINCNHYEVLLNNKVVNIIKERLT